MVSVLLVAALGVAVDTVYRGDEGALEVHVPRLEAPAVRIDGRLDEVEWSESAVLSGFTQYAPAEDIPASQATTVRVLYSGDAIYFGVEASDTEAGEIRASLRERDGDVTDDDWVRILLDTFNDNSRAYAFIVNPRGVQADGLWLEGSQRGRGPPIDLNPDFVWASAARITAEGWVAELRIPFASLRFRPGRSQTWGLNVAREVRRQEYVSSWAPVTGNVANQLLQSGRLVGLEGLEPRRLVELNPVATGLRSGEAGAGGELVRGDPEPALGLNARVGLTRNMVLDATLNPDFSQVEADADQVVVNERFALSFPEKRPFFLEGAEVFNTPQRLVYTRSIADPVGGAKVTGKVGPFDLGYLGALDESPVTFDEGQARAAFNLVRLRRDLGGGSTMGALYTDRTLVDGSAHNRVTALDARLVLADRYTLGTQVAGAWSDARFGSLVSADLRRSGRTFSWSAEVEDVHPEFRARSGFIPRVGFTRLQGETGYTFRGEPGAWLEDWGPEFEVEAIYDHGDFWGGRRYHEAEVEAGLDVSLRGPNGFVLSASNGYFAFDPDDYAHYGLGSADGGGPMAAPPALDNLRGVELFGRARPLAWLSINGRGAYGEVPIHAEASRGTELRLSPSANLLLPAGLFLDLSFTWSLIDRARGGRFSETQIPRLKAHYQLTRALFARAIVQYNLQQRDALRSSAGEPLVVGGTTSEAREEGELQYDLLVSYEPSPGTIVYAGWSRIRQGPESSYRPPDLLPVSERLFVKVSYLFRL